MTRVYLDEERVRSAGGFREQRIVRSGRPCTERSFQGVDCYRDTEGWYLFADFGAKLNPVIAAAMTRCTERGALGDSASPHRARGIYRIAGAEAIVEGYAVRGDRTQAIQIAATSFEKCAALHDLILAGKIWPDESHEEPQVPPPTRHFRGVLRELWGIIRREVARRFRATEEYLTKVGTGEIVP